MRVRYTIVFDVRGDIGDAIVMLINAISAERSFEFRSQMFWEVCGRVNDAPCQLC